MKCTVQSEESPGSPEVSHSGTTPVFLWDSPRVGQVSRPAVGR